jgi:hypothetical protein
VPTRAIVKCSCAVGKKMLRNTGVHNRCKDGNYSAGREFLFCKRKIDHSQSKLYRGVDSDLGNVTSVIHIHNSFLIKGLPLRPQRRIIYLCVILEAKHRNLDRVIAMISEHFKARSSSNSVRRPTSKKHNASPLQRPIDKCCLGK